MDGGGAGKVGASGRGRTRSAQPEKGAGQRTRAGARAVIAALVVTHNRPRALSETLSRLLAEELDRVTVVDNASTDATAEVLAEAARDPRVEVLTLGRNLGGAGGFEHGLRHVSATLDPDWVVVMDDDARPEPGAIAAFRHQLRAGAWDGWDAVAAAVRYPDGRICDMNRPSVNPFWHPRVFLRTAAGGGRAAFHLPDAAYDGPVRAIDGASFVGLFLSRRAIALGGYPDGSLFIYGDDVLYTLGLSAAGGRIAFAPGIRFEHACSTFARGRKRHDPMWKVYYHHRNLLFVYRRAAGLWFWPVLLLILPKWLAKARHYDGPSRRRFLGLVGRAIRDGLLGRRGTPVGPPAAREAAIRAGERPKAPPKGKAKGKPKGKGKGPGKAP